MLIYWYFSVRSFVHLFPIFSHSINLDKTFFVCCSYVHDFESSIIARVFVCLHCVFALFRVATPETLTCTLAPHRSWSLSLFFFDPDPLILILPYLILWSCFSNPLILLSWSPLILILWFYSFLILFLLSWSSLILILWSSSFWSCFFYLDLFWSWSFDLLSVLLILLVWSPLILILWSSFPLILFLLSWSLLILIFWSFFFSDPLILLFWSFDPDSLIFFFSDPLILLSWSFDPDLFYFPWSSDPLWSSLILWSFVLWSLDPLNLIFFDLDLFDSHWSIDPFWPFLILFIDLFDLNHLVCFSSLFD